MRKTLQHLRVSHDLTQEQMALELGVSRTTYNKIENGKSKGALAFWLEVKKRFPEFNMEELAKVEGLNETQAKNRSQ